MWKLFIAFVKTLWYGRPAASETCCYSERLARLADARRCGYLLAQSDIAYWSHRFVLLGIAEGAGYTFEEYLCDPVRAETVLVHVEAAMVRREAREQAPLANAAPYPSTPPVLVARPLELA